MEQHDILQIVNDHLKQINKLSHKLPEHFEIGTIDEFRTEFKVLRAFLRLLRFDQDATPRMNIPFKMKRFYGYAGIIRNLQMQQQLVISQLAGTNMKPPEQYLLILKHQQEYWQTKALELVDGNNFFDDENEIKRDLPDKLLSKDIKDYLSHFKQQISQLLMCLKSRDDDDLDKLRKLLSDLLYIWTYVNTYENMISELGTKEEISELRTLLNDLRDTEISLSFLPEAYLSDQANARETELLKQIRNTLVARQTMLHNEILKRLHHLKSSAVQHAELDTVRSGLIR